MFEITYIPSINLLIKQMFIDNLRYYLIVLNNLAAQAIAIHVSSN